MIAGIHYAVDFLEMEDAQVLNDPEKLVTYMQHTIEVAGLDIVGEPLIHRFEPHGITYLVLLAQSHLAVHTWPEHRYMAVDFFTCGDPVEGQKAYEGLKLRIPCGHVVEHVFERRTTL